MGTEELPHFGRFYGTLIARRQFGTRDWMESRKPLVSREMWRETNVIQQDHYVTFSALVHLGISIGTFNGGASIVRYGGYCRKVGLINSPWAPMHST